MKKYFILFLMMFMMTSISMNGQCKVKPLGEGTLNSSFLDNTYVGVLGGVTTNTPFNSVFPLNTVGGVKVGKNITPIFGVNIEGTTSFGSNVNGGGRYSYHNFVRGLYVGVNPTINLTNLVLGYNPHKVFSVSTETGLGWLHTFNSTSYGKDKNDFGTKLGVICDWKLGKEQKWSVYVEPTIYWNLTNGNKSVYFNKNNSQVGVEVGVNYHFKNKYGKRNFVKGFMYDPHKIKSLCVENGNLKKENETLKNLLAKKPKEVVVTKENTTYVEKNSWVKFEQGKYELSEESKKVLDKIPSGSNVKVIGTTSPEGTTKFNNKLSEDRANVVAEYLKGRGVNVLTTKGKEEGRLGLVTIVE